MKMVDEYIISIIYVSVGIILGFVTERILLQKLKHLTSKTTWKSDDLIIQSFHNITLFWFTLAGLYLGFHHLPIEQRFIDIADKAIFALVVFGATIVASRILTGLIRMKTEEGSTGPIPSTSIITNIVRIAVFILGVLLILQSFGISITPLLTALGVGGLAVALALQDTLSNLFSGIQVIASKQVKAGDYIKLASGEEGFVEDITWRNTIMKMTSNNLIVVPNSKIASSILTNFNLPEKEMSILVQVGVSYDADLEIVERVSIEVGKEVMQRVEGGVGNFEPLIRFHTFADSSVNYTVVLRAQEFTNQFLIKHEYIKALHRRFIKENIQIPFPIRTVYLKKDAE